MNIVAGRFRLVAELARGGMGMVWLAEELRPEGRGQRVVVKELLPELRDDPGMRAMFLDEAKLAARLRHSNIVRTLDVGGGERPFLALELLEGATLARVTRALGTARLPLALGVRVLAAVLAALHHAHELRDDRGLPLGVVHRDVSPNNVFLTVDGRVKLLDFGVAKSRGRATETRHGVLKGSVAYMSPDHVCGATIDRRADIFAVGILLRELVTGARLWGDLDEVAILRRLVERDIPPVDPCGVPPELSAICARAMAPQRSERFASADEMREALLDWTRRHDPAGSLGDIVPLLERLAAEDRARIQSSGRAEIVTLASAELVSVVDVLPAPTPTKPPTARRRSPWALGLAAGLLVTAALGVAATSWSSASLASGAPSDPGVGSAPTSDELPTIGIGRAVVPADPARLDADGDAVLREASPGTTLPSLPVPAVAAATDPSSLALDRENPYDPPASRREDARGSL